MSATKRLASVVITFVSFVTLAGCTSHHDSPVSGEPVPAPAKPRPPSPPLLRTALPAGRITLDYSGLPPKSRVEAQRIAISTLRFYQQHIGLPWHDMRLGFKVGTDSANYGGQFVAPLERCANLNPAVTIMLQSTAPADIDSSLPHELAHALFGCGVGNGRFAEAFAESLSMMYHRATKVEGHTGLEPAEYRQANRPGIGVPRGVFQNFVALSYSRYIMLGSALRLYEVAHPGFLRRLYQALYRQTRQLEQANGSIDLPYPPDELLTGRLIDPAFGTWLHGQYIFQDPPVRKLAMSYIEYRNQVRVVGISLYIVVQQPWKGLALTITVKEDPTIKFKCVTAASGPNAGLCPDSFFLNLRYIQALNPKLKQATIVVHDSQGRVVDAHTYPILPPF